MSEFYDDMAQTAIEMIDEFGADVILTRTAGAILDPVAGTKSAGQTISFVYRAILKSFRNDQINGTLEGRSQPGGSLIKRGDRLLIVSPEATVLESGVIPWGDMVAGVDPWGASHEDLNARVIVNGAPWQIIDIDIKKPAERTLVYFVHIRS